MNWIPIEKELPPEGQLVLAYIDCNGYALRRLVDEVWYDENENFDDSGLEVTHFAVLPTSP